MANELAKVPSPYSLQIESLENELAASEYAARLRLEEEAKLEALREEVAKDRRTHRTEVIATNTLQCVSSAGAGALSTWMWGRVPIGAILNTLIGTAATGVTLQESNRLGVRVASNSVKTLLHNQIAITTREIIRGM